MSVLLFTASRRCRISRDGEASRSLEGALPVLDVLWNVDDHGARPASPGDLESGSQGRFQPLRIGDQENMLGNRTHDAPHGGLLEGIGTDGRCGHLAADQHDGDRIRHAVTHRRHAVCNAGARSDDCDPDLAACSRIASGHEGCTLLVGRHDHRHRIVSVLGLFPLITEHSIKGGKDSAAAISEERSDTLVRQHLDDHLSTAHGGPR